MMRVTIKIESHAFVDEHLCDEILDPTLPDDPDSCGVAGAEIIIPLRKNRTAEFEFCYTEETTLGDVVHAILEKYHLLNCGIRVSFYSHDVRYWVVDSNANFKVALEKYLDPCSQSEIRSAIFVSLDAGTVCNDGQLRYVVNSREAGKHHQPHVHVSRPLRIFCVNVIRQNQEYHVINVHDGGLFPLSTSLPEVWDGMRAVGGVNAGSAFRENYFKGISLRCGRRT